jgi:hypothetical protein
VEFLETGAIELFGDGVAAAVPMEARRSRSLETMVRGGVGYSNGNSEILETLQRNELKNTCESLMMHGISLGKMLFELSGS